MRRLFLLPLVLCLVLLCGCIDVVPYKPVVSQAKKPAVFHVYVCGAVEREGYVDVFEGADLWTAVELAGFLPQSLVENSTTWITAETGPLFVMYFDGVKACPCVNVNGGLTEDMFVENVDKAVVNKIVSYIAANGTITDKSLLKEILGDDYQDNFYKFYVDERDYEKID